MREAVKKLTDEIFTPNVYDKIDEDEVLDGMVERARARGLDGNVSAAEAAELKAKLREVCAGMAKARPKTEAQGPEHTDKKHSQRVAAEAAREAQKISENSDETAKYVIAEGYRGTVARLHRRDGCYRGRDLVFKSYELVVGIPSPNAYTSVCRTCWPKGAPDWEEHAAENVQEVPDADDLTDSGTSSD